jgi:hypothetical protein
MRYKVTFYQCGVEFINPELYRTKERANKAACDFLRQFDSAILAGHRYEGSVYRDGYAAIRDRMGGTEALAEVHRLGIQ